MQLVKYIHIYIILFVFNIKLHSQVVYQDYRIEKNQLTSSDSKSKVASEPAIYFFIPTTGLEIEDSLLYAKKAEQLVKRLQTIEIDKLLLHFVYFKHDTKSNANGYLVFNKSKKDSIPIGQLECFFENFDTLLVARSSRFLKSNFKVIKPFSSDNLYRISITDGNKCFEKLQDRLPFYFDFIKESIQPNYSIEERFIKITDTLNAVRYSLVQLNEYNTKLELKIDSIRDILQVFFLEPNSIQRKSFTQKKH